LSIFCVIIIIIPVMLLLSLLETYVIMPIIHCVSVTYGVFEIGVDLI